MELLGPIAFIAFVVSMVFIYLTQREQASTPGSRRRSFRPQWTRRAGRTSSRRRRRPFGRR
ncbi:MAG: hypothetical protein PVF43_07460 [Candidatus Eiseniibacteriota bacterium]|jgi:hypothetical protein